MTSQVDKALPARPAPGEAGLAYPALSSWQQFGIDSLIFLIFALLFYRLFPQFLMQSFDAQNFFSFARSHHIWRSGLLELFVFYPLAGMGSQLWPLTEPFIPYLVVFRLLRDASLQVYLLQVGAALLHFWCCLALFAAVGLPRHLRIAGAWMSFAIVMLYALSYISSPDNLQALNLAYLSVAAFIMVGRGSTLRRQLAWVVAFWLTSAAFFLAVPSWYIIALPLVGTLAAAFLLFAEPAERIWKLCAGVIAAVVPIVSGGLHSLFLNFADTARVMQPQLYPEFPHTEYLAGNQFGNTALEIGLVSMAAIGLLAGTIRDECRRRADGLALEYGSLFFMAATTLWGLAFLYLPFDLIGPKPRYISQFALPLLSLFAVEGLRQCAVVMRQWRRGGLSISRGRFTAAASIVALILLWHALHGPARLLPIVSCRYRSRRRGVVAEPRLCLRYHGGPRRSAMGGRQQLGERRLWRRC